MIDEHIRTHRINAAKTMIPEIREAFDQSIVTIRDTIIEIKKKSRLFCPEVTLIKMRVNVRPFLRILFQKFKCLFSGNVCHNNNAAMTMMVLFGEILCALRIFQNFLNIPYLNISYLIFII